MALARARGLTLPAVVLAGMSLSLPPAGAAASVRPEFFGIVQGPRLDEQDRQTMVATRVRTVRLLLMWGSVQPAQGSFDWSHTDQLIGGLASHGIRAFPFIWGSPDWVAGTPAKPPIASDDAKQAWRDFLRAAVERYGPGGTYWAGDYLQQFGESEKPVPIQAWQVWNEPNLAKFFAPKPSARKYGRLLRISQRAIEAEDPGARIVLAGMPGYGGHQAGNPLAWRFLRHLYEVRGIKKAFDGAALNPYARNLDELREQVRKFRAAMKKSRDGRTPLWLTEIGWGSGAANPFGLNKGLVGQRRLLKRSFELVLRHRRVWNVRRLFWYDWRDPAPGSDFGNCSFCGSAGLLRYDRDPKPAYHAFTRFMGAG
jgi:polysaccharide biosynthesis protein PslG